jgi:CDP-glycerol glycerophosphotransferase
LPELTVIVPTHDVEPWLDDCLTSIRTQEGVDLRVIVVDDHSADGTRDIARRHAAADTRVTIIEAKKRGGGSARNLGISHVRSEFLAFADGDDLVPPGAYAALAGSLARTGSQLAVGNFYKFSSLRSWRPSLRWKAFDSRQAGIRLDGNPGLIWNRACWNRVFRTDFWRETDISFPDVPRSNDIVPMTKALVAADRIDVVPDYVYLYRERPGAGSMTASAGSVAGLVSYLDQEVACADLLAPQPEAVRAQYRRVVFDADGWVHLRRALLRSRSEGVAVPHAVVDRLRRLATMLDPDFIAGMPSQRRLVIELVLGGHVAAATDCLERLEVGWNSAGALDDLAFWIDMIELGADRNANERAGLLADLVLRPFGAVAAEIEAPALATSMSLLAGAGLNDVDEELGEALRPADRRVLRAVQAGDVDDLRRVSSIAHRDAILVQGARFHRGRFELDGVTDLSAAGSEFPVIARQRSTGNEVAVGMLGVSSRVSGVGESGDESWRLTFPARRIRSGEWQLVVRVGEDELGPMDVHLTAGRRGPLVPESRWARVVLVPRQQPGDRVVVVARGSLAARAARRLRSMIGRA